MSDNSVPLWDKLAGLAADAAKHGDWKRAGDLGAAAREAWLNHCEAVEGSFAAQRHAHRRKMAIEEWEYEQDLERGRGW